MVLPDGEWFAKQQAKQTETYRLWESIPVQEHLAMTDADAELALFVIADFVETPSYVERYQNAKIARG